MNPLVILAGFLTEMAELPHTASALVHSHSLALHTGFRKHWSRYVGYFNPILLHDRCAFDAQSAVPDLICSSLGARVQAFAIFILGGGGA